MADNTSSMLKDVIDLILHIIPFIVVIGILFLLVSIFFFNSTENLAKEEAEKIASRIETVLKEKGDLTRFSLAPDNLETVQLVVKGDPYLAFDVSRIDTNPYYYSVAEKSVLCVLMQSDESFYHCVNVDFPVCKQGKTSSDPCIEGSQYVLIGNKNDIVKIETTIPDFAIDFYSWIIKQTIPGGEVISDNFYFLEKRSDMFLSDNFEERSNALAKSKSVEFFVDSTGRILLFGPIARAQT